MALATQCPHCYTSFRVANDQLKLHAGLVRCGACQQTFNGVEYLLAPGTKPAVPGAPVAARPEPEFNATQEPDDRMALDTPETRSLPDPDEAAHIDLSAWDTADGNAPPSSDVLEFDLGDIAPVIQPNPVVDDDENDGLGLLTQVTLINSGSDDHARPEPSLDQPEPRFDPAPVPVTDGISAIEDLTAHGAATTPAKAWNAVMTDATDDAEQDEADKPEFVKQAEKRQKRSRTERILMIVAAILLFFTLIAQSTYLLRNHIVAWLPQTKQLMQQTCALLHCRIELLAQIDAVLIDSTELQIPSPDKNVFFLAIQLQNKSNTVQAWPMLELKLNDANDKPVVKRVFTPADYLTNKTDLVKGFAPNSEQGIKLYFELSGPKAAGYHVAVFYP